MSHLLYVCMLQQCLCWCRFPCHNQDLWSYMDDILPFPVWIIILHGSKYKFGNLFLNSGHGHASNLPENIFGHFVRTIANFLAEIFIGQDTIIWSPITAWEATAITLFLYSANLLFSLVQPKVKQCWLRNSSPKIKGLVNPLHTTDLWEKLDGPILKLTMTETLIPLSWPFAVLTLILLSEIWLNKLSVATISYLMQLTCAPVSKREENTKPPTLIFKCGTFGATSLNEQYFLLSCSVLLP